MPKGSGASKAAVLQRAAPAAKQIQKHPLRAVGGLAAAYCLGVAGVSVYTMAVTRQGVPDADAYVRCCHPLLEMLVVNLIVPPIAAGFLAFLVLNKDATRPRNVSEIEHIRVSTVFSILLLLGTFLPILAVTGTRALDRARPADCTALIEQATAGGPPLLITVNLLYLVSNSAFCLGCIVLLLARLAYKTTVHAEATKPPDISGGSA